MHQKLERRQMESNLRRETFQFLCLELRPYLQRRSVVWMPLSVEKRVAITLWRLRRNKHWISLSIVIGLSTIYVKVSDVRIAIVQHLTNQYTAIPAKHLKLVVDGFMSKWGVSKCVGAIYSTQIPIIAPKDNPLYYYNRKGYHSMVLQAQFDMYVDSDTWISSSSA